MPVVIRSETFQLAPNGRPNSRLTVGVGETMVFRTDPQREAFWTVDRDRTRQPLREHVYWFNRPGEFTVVAEVGGERGDLHVTVVAPSLRYEKVRDVTVPSGVSTWLASHGRPIPAELSTSLGVAMELRVVLEPLSVSFQTLQVRELDCRAEAATGVYAQPGMAGDHEATPGWTAVATGNALEFNDLVAACLNPSRFHWPIPASGYRWRIPVEYRVGEAGSAVRFPTPITQTVRFTPALGGTTPHGTFSLEKGGQSATARV